MREERRININELEDILKTHYGLKHVSVKRIWGGTEKNNMTSIDFFKGPGGILDIFLEVDDWKEYENEEVFSFNVVERIGERMAKHTQRMDALEWNIKNLEKHLVELKKEILKQKPVEINPDPESKLEWKLT